MLSIIGCGNSNRSDDGVGVYVVQQLKKKFGKLVNPEKVQIFDAGTSGMEVMFQARGSDALIIIDANKSGSEPGAIFQVPGEILANCHSPSFGLHDFRWDHALYAGKQIYKENFPQNIQVFLIEAEKLEFGLELSDVVKAAADRVVDQIAERLEKLQMVTIKNGNLYVNHELYKKFFNGIETIALMKRDTGFLVMPLFSQAIGGRLFKMRNTIGDRVVTATDFLEEFNLDGHDERHFLAAWDAGASALFVDLKKGAKA